ncbi:hypothetical protein BDA99DRAFT_294696 [Phascolomyces articulosus]|uniref:Heterokaryon incompatibility domain-containing protein n=1 Tax=Phascolomyces articulosus TaxID=60185 RepID=A0AAD5P7B1_9FUNG|nr:hypothetical protein BDA99DRAFT_294696 [Phascolomyces articulosus]
MLPIKESNDSKYMTRFSPSKKSKTKVRYGTFNELLQQLCKDFEIEYLWYDKICLDRSNKETRLREIKEMYQIYGNACYTVALVPEVHVHNPKDLEDVIPVFSQTQANIDASICISKSQWWKRGWTLEEAMMSKRVLQIGTNTHLWQHSIHTCNNPTTYDSLSAWMLDFGNQRQGKGGSTNQALHEAHFRTSSKEHDMIFP